MLNDPMISLLQKAVSGTALRHRSISNNIVNTNTPGYKRMDVDFKTTLSRMVEDSKNGNRTLKKDAGNPEFQVTREEHTALRPDGNNVDIDKEMTLLAKNSLEHEYYLTLLTKRLSMIKTVVNEGRR